MLFYNVICWDHKQYSSMLLKKCNRQFVKKCTFWKIGAGYAAFSWTPAIINPSCSGVDDGPSTIPMIWPS